MSTTKTFKLFPSQRKVLNSLEEIVVLVAGRGIGKSTIATHWVLRRITEQPEVVGFIGTPSHAQTNDLMTKLTTLLADIGIPYVIGRKPPASWGSNQVDHKYYLSFLLPGHERCGHIRFGTLENYEAQRGISIGWMLIDEAALVREIAYREVLVPALRGYGQEHTYHQLLLTTPKGVANWVSDLIDNRQVEVIRAPSAENFLEFPEEKLEYIRELMSERQYRQEILGEIVNVSNMAQYHAFSVNNRKKIDIDGEWFCASDQNIDPLVMVIGKYNKDSVVILDEIYIEGGAVVNDMVRELAKKPYLKGGIIKLYGDRSGNNKSLVSDQSFYQQLIKKSADKGIRFTDKTLNKNPPIYESRELVNAWLEKEKLFIAPNCSYLIRDMEKAQYTEDFKSNKKIWDAHVAESLVYMIWKEFSKAGKTSIQSGLYL